jgi:hypothetical protein
LFARPKTHLFYFYVKSTAVGASLFFMSAVAAGAGSVTAAMYVGWQRNRKATARLSGDTARQQKGKKPIAMPKTAADIGWVKKIKKTWMMHLQHGCRGGV